MKKVYGCLIAIMLMMAPISFVSADSEVIVEVVDQEYYQEEFDRAYWDDYLSRGPDGERCNTHESCGHRQASDRGSDRWDRDWWD